jgi:hypothetical protein
MKVTILVLGRIRFLVLWLPAPSAARRTSLPCGNAVSWPCRPALPQPEPGRPEPCICIRGSLHACRQCSSHRQQARYEEGIQFHGNFSKSKCGVNPRYVHQSRTEQSLLLRGRQQGDRRITFSSSQRLAELAWGTEGGSSMPAPQPWPLLLTGPVAWQSRHSTIQLPRSISCKADRALPQNGQASGTAHEGRLRCSVATRP